MALSPNVLSGLQLQTCGVFLLKCKAHCSSVLISRFAGHDLTNFVSIKWITAGFAQKYAGENGANFKYSEEQKQFHKDNPKEYLKYRKEIETELNRRFPLIINGTKEQLEALEFSRAEMSAKLRGNPILIDKLVPKNYAIGCRRPTPGNGYLEAISDERCTVIFDKIKEITETGVVTDDGVEHKMDVLVCATGFDNSWRPRYPTCGKNGVE